MLLCCSWGTLGRAAVGTGKRMRLERVDMFLCFAYKGHLAVLQWARENGCEWDSETCADAEDT